MPLPIQKTDSELRSILLTTDGKGKTEKEAALTELLFRATSKDKEFLDWLQHSPNPRVSAVYELWKTAETVTLRGAIHCVMETRPNLGFETHGLY